MKKFLILALANLAGFTLNAQVDVTRTNCRAPLATNQIIVVQALTVYQGITTAILACFTLDSSVTIDTATSPPTLRFPSGTGGNSFIFIDNETPSGLVNGTNDTYTLAHTPISGSLHLYRNGMRMKPSIDYTVSGSTITFLDVSVPQELDQLLVDYRY